MENKAGNTPAANVEKQFPLPIYAPYDPGVDLYVYSRTNLGFDSAVPYEYSGWRNET